MSNREPIFYAKITPKKTVLEHSIDAGCTANEILNTKVFKPLYEYLYETCYYEGKTSEDFTKWLSHLVALHDIGKISIKFQNNLLSTEEFLDEFKEPGLKFIFKNTCFRHEIYGSEIIKKNFNGYLYEEPLAAVIRMHHQKRNSRHNDELKIPRHKQYKQMEEKAQEKFLKELEEIFPTILKKKNLTIKNSSVWWTLFSGLLMLSDWISSSKEFVVNPTDYYNSARSKARELLSRFGLEIEDEIPVPKSFASFFDIDGKLRDIQEKCEKDLSYDSNLVIIEAPTGEGKTEAALYTALKMCEKQGKTGIYVALPTAATSNQMYLRVKNTLDKTGNIKLTHSSAWLTDENSFFVSANEEACEWLSSAKRALLCQNAVGTIDQALKSVMKVKYAFIKLLGLNNKVIILDEIHAYDSYMQTIISKMLEWFKEMNVPVIMLSATIPDKTKLEYLKIYTGKKIKVSYKYPLITYVQNKNIFEIECESLNDETLTFKQIPVLGQYETYANEVIKKASENGYIACICNTVSAAQQTYQIIKEKVDKEDEVFLLHSRFTTRDRNKLERILNEKFSKTGIKERPKKTILITTQIIEQSLDYDFDYMFTEIAPIDLLIQRAGREQRFGKIVNRSKVFNQKEVTVFVPSDKNYDVLEKIYFKELLIKTQEEITRHTEIKVPEDLRNTINNVYQNTLDKENFKAWSEMYVSEELKKECAGVSVIPSPDTVNFITKAKDPVKAYCQMEETTANTRLGNGGRRIVLINSEEEFIQAAEDKEKAKLIHLESIPIALYGKEIENKTIQGTSYLNGIIGVVSKDSIFYVEGKKYKYDSVLGLSKEQ